jgi:hypothetical protein
VSWLKRLLPKALRPCPACGGKLGPAEVRRQRGAPRQGHDDGCSACGGRFHTENGSLLQSAARPSPPLPALTAGPDRLVRTPDLQDGDFTPEHLRAFDDATRAFVAAGPELLDQVTEHLWAYYRDTADQVAAAGWETSSIPVLDAAADIWAAVTIDDRPTLSSGGTPLVPGAAYISFEGQVSWEPEHGLQLVFEDGETV